jgi:hypothetical protein
LPKYFPELAEHCPYPSLDKTAVNAFFNDFFTDSGNIQLGAGMIRSVYGINRETIIRMLYTAAESALYIWIFGR